MKKLKVIVKKKDIDVSMVKDLKDVYEITYINVPDHIIGVGIISFIDCYLEAHHPEYEYVSYSQVAHIKDYLLTPEYSKPLWVAPVIEKYVNGDNLAVELMITASDDPEISAGETWNILTVNLSHPNLESNEAFIDTNNNSDNILNWITTNNLGTVTNIAKCSGFCVYPLAKFNLDKLNTHDEYTTFMKSA